MEIEKQTAIAAEKKAKAVLDKIYFYDDKFGLAYQNDHYGFIDKDLNMKIEFKYETALPFDYHGFAKVGRTRYFTDESPTRHKFIDYLIDTLGVEYKLGTDILKLDSSITALDLMDKELKGIPSLVFKYNKLNIKKY